jgi:hypothetical protein
LVENNLTTCTPDPPYQSNSENNPHCQRILVMGGVAPIPAVRARLDTQN